MAYGFVSGSIHDRVIVHNSLANITKLSLNE